MWTWRQLSTIPWILGWLLLATSTLAAQEARSIVTLEVALTSYLTQDCGTGETNPDRWLQRVVEAGGEVVPSLALAVRQGLPAETRAAVEKTAREDFRRLREFLDDGGLEGLEEQEVVEAARGLDAAGYTEQRVRGADRAYRERAIHALTKLWDVGGAEVLRKLSAGSDLPSDTRKRLLQAVEQPAVQ